MINHYGCLGCQYRIYPNAEQEQFIIRCLEAKNGVYNYLLDLKLANFQKGRELTFENMYDKVKKIQGKYATVEILSDYEITSIIARLEQDMKINENIRKGGFKSHERYYENTLSNMVDIAKEYVHLNGNDLYINRIGHIVIEKRCRFPKNAKIFRFRIMVEQDRFYLLAALFSNNEHEIDYQPFLYNPNVLEGHYNHYRNHRRCSCQHFKRQLLKRNNVASCYQYLKRNRLIKSRALNRTKNNSGNSKPI